MDAFTPDLGNYVINGNLIHTEAEEVEYFAVNDCISAEKVVDFLIDVVNEGKIRLTSEEIDKLLDCDIASVVFAKRKNR